MPAFVNRLLLIALLAAALAIMGWTAWQSLLDHYAGAWTHAPEDAPWLLPESAQALVDAAFAGAAKKTIMDDRIDMLSLGLPIGPGITERIRMANDNDKYGSPLAWLSKRVRQHAAGIRNASQADGEYLSRLLRQMQAMPGDYRGRLLARDAVYDRDGQRDDARTLNYVANEYVVWLASQAPDRLSPVVSIHPYRRDAVAAIARWAKAGVTGINWRPIAQGIDLDDPRLAAVYKALAGHGMTLYLPVGYRKANNGAAGWIDPQALRAPLKAGVDVVVMVGAAKSDEGQSAMPAIFALLREPVLARHLAIDLAGVLAPSQLDSVLAPLLQHPQFFDHLRYASGYPQPAIAADISLDALADRDFIDPGLIAPLRAIYDVNPLLFAFVTLRQVHLPATDLCLPDRVFFTDASSS